MKCPNVLDIKYILDIHIFFHSTNYKCQHASYPPNGRLYITVGFNWISWRHLESALGGNVKALAVIGYYVVNYI